MSRSKQNGSGEKSPRALFRALIVIIFAAFVGLGAIAVHLMRKTVEPERKPAEPLTDVAPERTGAPHLSGDPHKRLEILRRERAERRKRRAGEAGEKTLPPKKVRPPELMPDPNDPPRWTRTIARPREPRPPDPSVPPPLDIDPETGRAPGEGGARREE
jgi:hypothetical protein